MFSLSIQKLDKFFLILTPVNHSLEAISLAEGYTITPRDVPVEAENGLFLRLNSSSGQEEQKKDGVTSTHDASLRVAKLRLTLILLCQIILYPICFSHFLLEPAITFGTKIE